jgi:hypothetical protein
MAEGHVCGRLPRMGLGAYSPRKCLKFEAQCDFVGRGGTRGDWEHLPPACMLKKALSYP